VGFAGFWVGSYAYTFEPSVGSYAPLSVTNRVVMVPWYGVIVTTAALPLVRLRRASARRRRAGAGRCGACGYDLTGNESGVCPECGQGHTVTGSLEAGP
jgi:hypothetical protein